MKENNGCFKCRKVNVNHLAKECRRDLSKYGLPKDAMKGYEEWKNNKFRKKGHVSAVEPKSDISPSTS